MARYKHVKEKPKRTHGRFLRFEEGKPKKLVVNNWSFERGHSGYMFMCYVEQEDGEKVDKLWYVWDWESTEQLKKKLKPTKYVSGKKEITVVMSKNDDDEMTFEVK